MNLGQQHFYGHGKLLLTGEYLVLEGARAVALPTNFGQRMNVRYHRSHDPKLFWKCFDQNGQLWLEASFELWHFNLLSEETKETLLLQKVLREARRQNVHFLREDVDTIVECQLEFGRDWGLGSSSTFIYNVAQWAYISALELNRNVSGGSGYDVACAGAVGPIYYQLQKGVSKWGTVNFNPHFKDQLFFVHLGRKQDTNAHINLFKQQGMQGDTAAVQRVSQISEEILKCVDVEEFGQLLLEHELIISRITGLPPVQQQYFSDYPGMIKSLGAWGGDFVLATSQGDVHKCKEYFRSKGHGLILDYDEMICGSATQGQVLLDPSQLISGPVYEYRS